MKIVRSKLQAVFERWTRDLEQRDLAGFELHMCSTTLEGSKAYVLFDPKKGLYCTITQDRENCRNVCLITMQSRLGNEQQIQADVQSVAADAVLTLSFLTAHFLVDRAGMSYTQLYEAYPEIDTRNHVISLSRREMNISEFLQ